MILGERKPDPRKGISQDAEVRKHMQTVIDSPEQELRLIVNGPPRYVQHKLKQTLGKRGIRISTQRFDRLLIVRKES